MRTYIAICRPIAFPPVRATMALCTPLFDINTK